MSATISWETHLSLRRTALGWAVAAGAGLLALYVLVVGLVNSFPHAVQEFAKLWPWMTALVLGFATQVGLFAYARAAARAERTAGTGAIAASGGTSAVSMIACCAHHLADVLPLVGLAGAALFLAAHQQLFLLLGVLSSAVGLVFLLGEIRRHGLYPAQPSFLSTAVRWPADRAWPYVFAGAVVILGVATAVTAAAAQPGEAGRGSVQETSYAPQLSPGRVSLQVQPRWEGGQLIFALSANTHSVELSGVDLAQVVRLHVGGRALAPIRAGALAGHHAHADIAFALAAPPEGFRLEIRDVPDVSVRAFDWPARVKN